MPSPLIAEVLRRRVRERGADPLLTYYDLGSGERTELSATTFVNWVDKTSNLLVDELGVEPGDAVELALSGSHPGHWVTLIWAMAGWQTGLEVTVGRPAGASVLIVGPDTGWSAARRTQVVFCSLHPLGLPGAAVDGVLDYTLEVRGQADQFSATRPLESAPAWRDDTRGLTQLDLIGTAAGAAARRLVLPSDPWSTLQQALLTPLLAGGSAVVVTGEADPGELDRIRTSERVDR